MLDESLPPEAAPPATASMALPIPGPTAQATIGPSGPVGDATAYMRQVIDQQLAIMAQQLAVLGGAPAAIPAPMPAPPQSQAPPASSPPAAIAPPRNEEELAAGPQTYDVKKAFGAIARIHTAVDELTPQQRARLDAFIAPLHRAHAHVEGLHGEASRPYGRSRAWSTASARSPRSSPTRS